ncbi:MAG: response regulator transcription factor, partial [Candidatus Sericytochromatia bacterium]|nr:response regulator transcription factor [Candidatus Sericytochromatia bacterium]
VGEARDGAEAVRLAKQLQPDIVLMDLNMPKMDGLTALKAIKEQRPLTRVIILTSVDDEAILFKVIQAGGSGYVLKKAAEDELLAAIRAVQAGHAFVRPPVAQMLITEFLTEVTAGEHGETYESLTPREKEVLNLLARGMTNPQVAESLVISVRTVETHRAHIMDKLGFRDRSSLVAYALRRGYLS